MLIKSTLNPDLPKAAEGKDLSFPEVGFDLHKIPDILFEVSRTFFAMTGKL